MFLREAPGIGAKRKQSLEKMDFLYGPKCWIQLRLSLVPSHLDLYWVKHIQNSYRPGSILLPGVLDMTL